MSFLENLCFLNINVTLVSGSVISNYFLLIIMFEFIKLETFIHFMYGVVDASLNEVRVQNC